MGAGASYPRVTKTAVASPGDADVSAVVRLVPIRDLEQSRGLIAISGVGATTFLFEKAPPFGVISYRQLDVGLGDSQRLSAKDVLCACLTAREHGCTHVWLDALCGITSTTANGHADTYSHERFLANLRVSLEHSRVIVAVGDGGCTERPPELDFRVSDYLCRLWPRFELRLALRSDKLAFASPDHRSALVLGRGLGVQSRMLWADPTKQISASLTQRPRLVAALDVCSVAAVWLSAFLFVLTAVALGHDRQRYLGPSYSEIAAITEFFAVLVPIVVGPIGFRAFLLRRYAFALSETAQIHRLRRALATDNRTLAAEISDADPFQMPCFEPCDRLIVADLMHKRHGDHASLFWAHVLSFGLAALSGDAAATSSGRKVLVALLEEARGRGSHWASLILDALPAPADEVPGSETSAFDEKVRHALTLRAADTSRSLHTAANNASPSIVRGAQPRRTKAEAAVEAGGRAAGVVVAAAGGVASAAVGRVAGVRGVQPGRARLGPPPWAGGRLALDVLYNRGAKIYADIACGYATLRCNGGCLRLERRRDAPTWFVRRGSGAALYTRRPLAAVEHLRHFTALGADAAFFIVATISAVGIVDDYVDHAAGDGYDTEFVSHALAQQAIDVLLMPALAVWVFAEVCSLVLSLALRACGCGGGRELKVGRYHGWGGWFLLVEFDLLVLYLCALLSGNPQSQINRLVRAAQSDDDFFFDSFWDLAPFVILRLTAALAIFLPARILEVAHLALQSPPWLLRRPRVFATVALAALNPHFTGVPFCSDDVLEDVNPQAIGLDEEARRTSVAVRPSADDRV